jgi:hypothetical protein
VPEKEEKTSELCKLIISAKCRQLGKACGYGSVVVCIAVGNFRGKQCDNAVCVPGTHCGALVDNCARGTHLRVVLVFNTEHGKECVVIMYSRRFVTACVSHICMDIMSF